jgi:hypothetical protein
MGTSALTGNDSGCSDRLDHMVSIRTCKCPKSAETRSLRSLPDEADAIFRCFAETKDPARAHADACFLDSRDCVQALVVGPGSDDLDENINHSKPSCDVRLTFG